MAGNFFSLLLACFFCAQTITAADKSGVSPNTISLPKGPGSIEGLGESFQPTLNTGTAKYGIALKVPPGAAGQTPRLSLSYEGGGGNGPLGFGWNLHLPMIQRRTDKGTPLYEGESPPTILDDWTARYTSFINEMKEDLVPRADGYFFCRNEGAFVRYRRTNDYWQGTLPDGTRLEFGASPMARISAGTNRVFCWMLEREADTHGNTILYSYTNFPGLENTNQIYLAEIRYGPGAPPWANFHFVRFEYEDRADWFEDCRAGFQIRTGKRLASILIGTQGPTLAGHAQGDFNGDGSADNLVRRYELRYLNYAGTNTHWSLLAEVAVIGADNTATLPPSTFGYTVCNPPDSLSATGQITLSLSEPPVVMSDTNVDLVDLNGDGLPDLLRTGVNPHRAYLNQGEVATGGSTFLRWTNFVSMTGDSQAFGYSLGQSSVHLADLDGDGLADLVSQPSANTIYLFRNTGTNAWSNRRTMLAQDVVPPSPFGNADVRTADLDFDKNIDIIQSVDASRYYVWLNLGTNRYAARKTQTNTLGALFSSAEVQVADFNGDRMPDVVQVRQDSVVVTPGLGYGRFAEPIIVDFPEFLTAAQVQRARLQDITGDGLADLVIERAAGNEFWYWINLGNYRFSNRKTITGLPTIGPNAVVRWADLNGNGSTDLVYADGSAANKLRYVDLGLLLNCGTAPNVLTIISNGIGRATFIGYAPSTQFALEDAAAGQTWTNAMPFPVQVVASVTNLDSLGHSYVTQFRYHDGYYDPVEKQFRGYARVEQVDGGDASAPTLVTRSYFDTGRNFEVMKGRLLRLTTETELGLAFADETTSWSLPPVTLHIGTNGQLVQYVHPTASLRLVKELGQGVERRLESEMGYDLFGNQTTNADYGIVEGGNRSAFDDERITVTEYAINTNAWILHTPARQEIRDETGAVISRAEHFYDDETFSGNNSGIVTIGNLTLKRDWISPSNSAATISSARTKFDGYGNPITILDPLSVAPGGSVDFLKGHAREIAYDTRFHTHPITETIHVGSGSAPLLFQAGYDEGFGTVVNSADFNTNTTIYGYDVFARLTSIVKPGDSPAYPTVEYTYALAVPFAATSVINYVETRQLDKTPGTAGAKRNHYLLSRQFVDGLGRKLLTKQEAEPAPGNAAPRVVVTEAVQFNARQKSARVLNPFFSLLGGSLDDLLAFENIEAPGWQGQFHNEGNLVTLDLASAHATRTEYDATLRASRVTNSDGTFRLTVYEPLLTRSFDENDTDPASPNFNTPILHYSDGLGRLVQVDETTKLNDDGTLGRDIRAWTTRYGYDLNDQLIRITDSQSNVKTFTYDGLKRKTGMNDPDRGVMHFLYDDASNLIETTDAKGQRITHTYDGANRIRTEKYHEGRPPPPWRFSGESFTNSVVFHYDTPYPNLSQGDNTLATGRNVRGALAWVEDLSGEEHTSYDTRGRVESVVKRIPEPRFLSATNPQLSTPLVSFRTAFGYDSLDRLTNLTYPDADQLRHEYNDRNLLQRIPGGPSGSVIGGIAYQPSSQIAQIDYGNGVRTTYAYDSRLRLKELSTLNPQLAIELVHFGYDFDGVSNIKSIADLRPGSTVPEGDPRRNTQLFGYDDLYRLTRVQYSFALPGGASRNDGEINYRYDRIGNMLAQNSTLDHQERGLPVANLGEMDSGGASGRWNRAGRAANDPAGPHALTAIRHPQLATRTYPYDANGNMTNIDGLVCTWDFKDRLVAVENDEMRATYAYDYTDRRIIKDVAYKPGSANATNHDSRITTLYINKYFEVREHDAPTKYVWNGSTRVARVTGSLNTNVRVQRLRVWPGWNLCSIVLGEASLPSSPEIITAYRWNPATKDWDSMAANAALPANAILWLAVSTNTTLTFTGTYSVPTNRTVLADGDFLPSAGLEDWNIASTFNSEPTTTVHTYGAQTDHWFSWLPSPLGQRSDLPFFIAPGEAVFVRSDAPVQLEVPDSALRIRYYHEDHLSSSSCVSDSAGDAVEEATLYPHGYPRHRYAPRQVSENYMFTQKEIDAESGLNYFERRLLNGVFGRFVSPDTLMIELRPMAERLPQRHNPYSYAENRPMVMIDRDGRYPTEYRILGLNVAGENIHAASVDRALKGLASPSDMSLLKAGVTRADASQFQDAMHSFMHSMRAPWQSEETAKSLANNFIRNELNFASALEKLGTQEAHAIAMERVGFAMHVLQDSTSPEHHGFKIWRGEHDEHLTSKLSHGLGERFDPLGGSNLDRATVRVWQAWEQAKASGVIPRGFDFFREIGVDSMRPQTTANPLFDVESSAPTVRGRYP